MYKNNFNYMSWEEFHLGCMNINQKLLSLLDENHYQKEDIMLVGIARGGLPMLTCISHLSGIKNTLTIHMRMTNSDQPFDYGTVKCLLEFPKFNEKNVIIFDDVLYKGNTFNYVYSLMEKIQKRVILYSTLVKDESLNILNHIQVPYYSSYIIKSESWIYFPWELENVKKNSI